MHPSVDVGFAAEIPDHGGTFNLPDIPDAVLADILIFVERHVQGIEAAFADQLHGLCGSVRGGAVRRDDAVRAHQPVDRLAASVLARVILRAR